MAIDPNDELAPMIIKWMVNNRRGNHWSSTKETTMRSRRPSRAHAGEAGAGARLYGHRGRRRQGAAAHPRHRENTLVFDNRFLVGDEFLGDGARHVTITVQGKGSLYYAAYLRYFSLEEDIKGGGNEIFVKRRYFKLTPQVGGPGGPAASHWQQLDYDRARLASGAHSRAAT